MMCSIYLAHFFKLPACRSPLHAGVEGGGAASRARVAVVGGEPGRFLVMSKAKGAAVVRGEREED